MHATMTQHPFNGLFSRTTWVSWYQKGRIILDFDEARDDRVVDFSRAAPHYSLAGCPS